MCVCVGGGGGEVAGILNKIYTCIKLMTSPPCKVLAISRQSMYILNVCGGKGLGY